MRNKVLRSQTLNNVKSNFSFNEMNKKDVPGMYSTVFWYLIVVLLFFLAFSSYEGSNSGYVIKPKNKTVKRQSDTKVTRQLW